MYNFKIDRGDKKPLETDSTIKECQVDSNGVFEITIRPDLSSDNYKRNKYSNNDGAKDGGEFVSEIVRDNFIEAVEEMPESFIKISMLYIKCQIADFSISAFIDTGAETSIISEEFCKKAQIMHLIDTKFKTMAIGVGQQEMIGRIHKIPVGFGNYQENLSFYVMPLPKFHLLIGLDMLQKYRACIDLNLRHILIGSTKLQIMNDSHARYLEKGVETKILNDIQPLLDQDFGLIESVEAYKAHKNDVDAACAFLIQKNNKF